VLRRRADCTRAIVKPRNERGRSRKSNHRSSHGRTAPRGSTPRTARQDRGLGGTQIEGRQAVRELLLAGRRRVHEIVVSDDLEANPVMTDILDLARDQRVPVKKIPRRELERDARSEAPQGVIAYAEEIVESDLADFVPTEQRRKPFLIAIDGVTDPGNLGAILRSCDGAASTASSCRGIVRFMSRRPPRSLPQVRSSTCRCASSEDCRRHFGS